MVRKMKIRHYVYDVNYNRQSSVKRSVRRVIACIVVAAIGFAGYLAYDSMRLSNAEPSEPSIRKSTSYDVPRSHFQTNYFSFDGPDSWTFAKKESTKNKFIYWDIRHKLVRNELIVYIDTRPDTEHQYATRVLPVTLGSDGILKPTKVSGHCNKKAPGKDKVGEEIFVFNKVKFQCDNDSTFYSVMVGLEGKSTSMELQRRNGFRTRYLIYYRSASAEETPADLLEVIENFQIL